MKAFNCIIFLLVQLFCIDVSWQSGAKPQTHSRVFAPETGLGLRTPAPQLEILKIFPQKNVSVTAFFSACSDNQFKKHFFVLNSLRYIGLIKKWPKFGIPFLTPTF